LLLGRDSLGWATMKPKRSVSANLGRTQHRHADKHYASIRARIGATRPCPFYGGKKYRQFSPQSHNQFNPDLPNPAVPIEEFDFAIKKDGVWGLQAYCKVCYKAYRRGRIEVARQRWITMSDEEIRQWYRKNVAKTMRCSVCHKHLDPTHYPISRSMEKGLHNECFNCVASKGVSVREQVWLSDGDWLSWKEAVISMRREPLVECAGWPPAVAAGFCRGARSGKRMHADHKVPLRAGGINDVRNFQPLCTGCNSVKTDQLDRRLSAKQIRALVGKVYQGKVHAGESVSTIERRLKAALITRLEGLEQKGVYLDAIRAKKKEVNGQWVVGHAYRKGKEWLIRGGRREISE